jgi:hypothetical protein
MKEPHGRSREAIEPLRVARAPVPASRSSKTTREAQTTPKADNARMRNYNCSATATDGTAAAASSSARAEAMSSSSRDSTAPIDVRYRNISF